MAQEIIAATDGSALMNPGPAGWAWYIDHDNWSAGGWEHATNNQGELRAVLELFEATAHLPEHKLKVLCDSQYTINAVTKWLPGWKKKGWKKADGKPVQNQELIQALDEAMQGRNYEFVWVKGHSGQDMNEAADTRARDAALSFQQGTPTPSGPGFNLEVSPETDTKHVPQETKNSSVEDHTKNPSTAMNVDDVLELVKGYERTLYQPEHYEQEQYLEKVLGEDFWWVTYQGIRTQRSLAVEYRTRAFYAHDEPIFISCEMLGDSVIRLLSRVKTRHMSVMRTSLWVQDTTGDLGWILSSRQDTACPQES
ncbi:RNase H family protein [Rothia sp. P7208]|uniref:RNase H family protein n=1 Tax=Rothia sp. P7208 TaxID=3402660 RepID=UPI003AC9B17F